MPRPEHGRLSGTPVPNRGRVERLYTKGRLVVLDLTNPPQSHRARKPDQTNFGSYGRVALAETLDVGHKIVSDPLFGGQVYTIKFAENNPYQVMEATGVLDKWFLDCPDVTWGNGVIRTGLERMHLLAFPIASIIHTETKTQVYPRPDKK